MPHSQESILSRYAVSLKNGFLPEAPPAQKLEDSYYAPWEELAVNLAGLIQNGDIRRAVNSLPVLSASKLEDESEYRRAYVVLAYLTHAYIWGGEKPEDRLPPSISCPFLEVSSHLELPPCATYAAVGLWNYSVPSKATDLTDPDNLSYVTSFTGAKDEEWFIMVSVAIEAAGAKLIPQMLDAIDAVEANNSSRVVSVLNDLATGLDEITYILGRMYEKCSPAFFFHQLRPFLAGSKNMAAAGLPNGVFYDRGDGKGEWRQYCGGSNAQSSLIQTFDIFLGVQHSGSEESGSNAYLLSMRKYMPGPHHRFLGLLSKHSNVRHYALEHAPNTAIRNAYNTAAMALSSLRDKHMQIVARYILLASKSKPVNAANGQVNIATATSKIKDSAEDSTEYQGTGGTSLMPFLKQTRDATKDAASYVDGG